MAGTVLVTGGAGFIGAYVTRALLARGYRVRVLDSLIEQVHGPLPQASHPKDAEFLHGDVRDADLVVRALRGVESVIHLAAEVGVGQSMYAIERYVSANDLGTAVLMQALSQHRVARIVVASSMSVYGEGRYVTAAGAAYDHAVRRAGTPGWDPLGPRGEALTPCATPEEKPVSLASVYALTKYVQEQMVLNVAAAYGMEAVALRLFNVYGAGQALSNPYTGVLAIFASRLLNGERPMVFEDGAQRRDFVHVADVADGFLLALETGGIGGRVFNIGSGRSVTVRDVALQFAAAMGREDLRPDISGKMRVGDIRHCFADIAAARAELGYAPRRSFEDSFAEIAAWVKRQQAVDRVKEARLELERRGLVA